MRLLNKKMLLAPILAVALVLSIAAAVSYLPLSAQTALPNQPTPSSRTSLAPNVTVAPSPSSPTAGYSAAQAPPQTPLEAPVPAPSSVVPTSAPTAVPMATTSSVNYLPILSVVAAVLIGVVAGLLLFSEKGLKKDLARDRNS